MKLNLIGKILASSLIAIFINLSAANAAGVAIVDMKTVSEKSEAMKDAYKKISKKKKLFEKEIAVKQKSLEKEGKKIEAKKAILSEKAFEKARDALFSKLQDLESLAESRGKSFEEMILEANDQVSEKFIESVEEIRAEKEYDVVIEKANIIASKDGIDISAEVIERLNKKIKKVNIK
ncbi:MAG: Skp family chaperone for outer membrane protein [Myxococcota bacterium]|jgi:Skp family chaperone for outer membrane proteins